MSNPQDLTFREVIDLFREVISGAWAEVKVYAPRDDRPVAPLVVSFAGGSYLSEPVPAHGGYSVVLSDEIVVGVSGATANRGRVEKATLQLSERDFEQATVIGEPDALRLWFTQAGVTLVFTIPVEDE